MSKNRPSLQEEIDNLIIEALIRSKSKDERYPGTLASGFYKKNPLDHLLKPENFMSDEDPKIEDQTYEARPTAPWERRSKYTKACRNGHVVEVFTQEDRNPEYRAFVWIKCQLCSSKVSFSLPVN